MSPLALLLALASAVRPTSLAAVYAILASRRPRRLLFVFDVAGLAVTIGIGILLVAVFHRVIGAERKPPAIVNLVLAVGCFAGALAVRRMQPREQERQSRAATTRITSRLRDPSPATAAVAGVLTHFPGIFYLIALNAIIATDPTVPSGVLQVLVYNAIWFAIPLLALMLAILRPDRTGEAVEQITEWARSHQRTAVPLLLVALGVYLVVKGASTLA